MTAFTTRLTLARQFALLGAIGALLFIVPFGFFARQLLDEVALLRQAQQGIAPAAAVLQVVQLTQQHRGLVNGGLKEERARKQAEADPVYARVGALLAGDSEAAKLWQRAAADWSAITRDYAADKLPPAESFPRHNALVAQLLETVTLLTEQHGLAYDSAPDAHHLVKAALVELPQLTESLGRARALGSAYLAAGSLDQARQTPVAALVQTARLLRGSVLASLDKAGRARPPLRAALEQPARQALQQVDAAIALVEREVLRPDMPTMPAAPYFQGMTTAIDAQFALQTRAGAQLEALFAERIAQQHRVLAAVLAGLLACALVAIGIGVLIVRSISGRVRDAVRLAQRVADGDLTVQLHTRGGDEIAQLQAALSTMVLRLRQLLGEVTGGARLVSDTSAQIAQGNADLSQRTEEQASTLEETASSLEELVSTVSQNAENARRASELAAGASQVAREGGTAVGAVTRTMEEIAASSQRIAEIITVIDGIAFQTNILALNAAVEAARAGTQGRGFAVVAGEVRALAQRSAEAAREIKGLIGESTQKVQEGTRIVADAGRTISGLVGSVEDVSGLISEIAAASREQSTGLEQVNVAVMQMDQVVQQNASLVEEAAAATESLKQEAASLLAMVSRFRLEEHRAPQRRAWQESLPAPLSPVLAG